jgi:hypothetical protein
VQAESAFLPDWRDAAAYAPLLDADRSLFAWEWLRRDPSYRAAAGAALGSNGEAQFRQPGDFGLIRFELPHLAVPNARPMWRADVHPYVLPADVSRPTGESDRFDLESLRQLATIFEDEDGEHLLLSDGLRMVRLDARRGSITGGPVCLRYVLCGLASAEPPLLTLRRLLALCRSGRFSRSLHAREARARRWVLKLRAADALAGTADQREIAGVLLSGSVAEPAWRSREPSIRLQVQRLVRSARRMTNGGYRQFLGR